MRYKLRKLFQYFQTHLQSRHLDAINNPRRSELARPHFMEKYFPGHEPKAMTPRPLGINFYQMKPVFLVGSRVFGPWGEKNDYYPGKISCEKIVEGKGEYGDIRHCDIEFDDDDSATSVGKEFVLPHDDYLLNSEYFIASQNHFSNLTDPSSKDQWAKIVGCYCTTIKNEVVLIKSLSEAKIAVDQGKSLLLLYLIIREYLVLLFLLTNSMLRTWNTHF